jgi:hypothetical protein
MMIIILTTATTTIILAAGGDFSLYHQVQNSQGASNLLSNKYLGSGVSTMKLTIPFHPLQTKNAWKYTSPCLIKHHAMKTYREVDV